MKTIFWRELRENSKWAAVIAALVMFFVLNDIRKASPSFVLELSQGLTIFVAPLAGALMGAAQSFFEMRSDNWAFAVHRPVTRRAVFAGKSLAGLLLLYAALALPLTYGVLWAMRPGNQPTPFQGRMVLPLVADVLNGGCYYFATMVVLLRRARWYGTRILPIGMALASSVVITLFVAEFWQALTVILIAEGLTALAAWSVFAGNGDPDETPWARLALAATIVPGALAVGMGLAGFSQTFLPSGHGWQSYQIDREGNPVVVTLIMEGGARRWTFIDPQGHPITKYDGLDLDDPANSNLFVRAGTPLYDERNLSSVEKKFVAMDYRSALPGVIGLNAVAPAGTRLRYAALYNVQDQLIDLIDPNTRMIVGRVGPTGYAPSPDASPERFAERPLNLMGQRSRRVLPFAHAVYWLELDQRRVRKIFAPMTGDQVVAAAQIGPAADPSVVLLTQRSLILQKPSGTVTFTAGLPVDMATNALDATMLASGHLMIRTYPRPGFVDQTPELMEYTSAGQIMHRTPLPRLADLSGPKPYETATFGAIFPLAARPLVPMWALDSMLDTRAEEYAALFTGAMASAAIAAGLLTLLLGRRYDLGWPALLAWTAAAVLLGPAGLVAFLGLHARVVREQCAACGKLRSTHQRLCSTCHAPPAGVVQDGREIFEPVELLAGLERA